MKNVNIDPGWISRPGLNMSLPTGFRWIFIILAVGILLAYITHRHTMRAAGKGAETVSGAGLLVMLVVVLILTLVGFMTIPDPTDYGNNRTTLIARCPDGCDISTHDITEPDAILKATGVPVSVVRPVQAPANQDQRPESTSNKEPTVDDVLNHHTNTNDPSEVWDAIRDQGSTRVVTVERHPVMVVIDWVDVHGGVHHNGIMEVQPNGRISLYDAHHQAIPRQDPDAVLAHAVNPDQLTIGDRTAQDRPGKDAPWQTSISTGNTLHVVNVHTIGGHLWLSDAKTGKAVDLPQR